MANANHTRLQIDKITVKNLLSFGDEGAVVKIQPLNVLIGPNGSGKSNFLDVFRVLQAMPGELRRAFSTSGGVAEWVWKGGSQQPSITVDILEHLSVPEDAVGIAIHGESHIAYQHTLVFGHDNSKLHIERELIQTGLSDASRLDLFESDGRRAKIRSGPEANGSWPLEELGVADYNASNSCLSQFVDPLAHPLLRRIANLYGSISLYTDGNFGRGTSARMAQQADLDASQLNEDGSNLALVVNLLQNQPKIWMQITERMREFYPRFRNLRTVVTYGMVQLYFEEDGLQSNIPATRISDGTLRYLFLLMLLCHPEPPPLICIEEPELGLHPDMIRSVGELLKEASARTQLIVTTHSDLLLSALSDDPTCVLVCEHDGTSTSINRLEADKLNEWLKQYSLGDLWLTGEIGGTRW